MRKKLFNRFIWSAAGAVVLISMFLAQPAHGFILTDTLILEMLSQLNQMMAQQVGSPLASSATTSNQMASYQQQTLYPQSKISAALRYASQLTSVMTSGQNLFKSPTNSATLSQTMTFERQLMSANTSNVGSVQSSYQTVYGPLPAASAMHSSTRVVVDMSDAQAKAAMKKAIALDAIANSEEQVSIQMMKNLAGAAPGSASMIGAQAQAWNLQANGYTQGGIAQLLRLESANTAYTGYQTKRLSTSAQTTNY